jgi:hypothetical protein
LASTSERPEGAEALSQPELNPLLNPLLADNMGRWAEVYFTNPPERREEAVLELLRELEGSQVATRSAPAPVAPKNPVREFRKAPEAVVAASQPSLRFCGACGRENPASHQFCGICGANLYRDVPAHDDEPVEVLDATAPVNGQVPESYGDGAAEFYAEPEAPNPDPVFHAPAAGSGDLSLFQNLLSRDPEEDYEPGRSGHYRLYIAAVLVMIIGALGYMAWRGSQTSQNAHEASPPPPAPVTDTAPPAVPDAPAASAPVPTTPARKAPETATSASKPGNVEPSASAKGAKSQVAKSTPAPEPAQQDTAADETPSVGGIKELAMAERYLSGVSGQGRDSSEAARWLWKSIAKHNGQAILLLADLYLRGDGVSKNCEQGRVLLDSAAQKGVAGAGERLRNLQAFGCH